jgi:hypothetical protein
MLRGRPARFTAVADIARLGTRGSPVVRPGGFKATIAVVFAASGAQTHGTVKDPLLTFRRREESQWRRRHRGSARPGATGLRACSICARARVSRCGGTPSRMLFNVKQPRCALSRWRAAPWERRAGPVIGFSAFRARTRGRCPCSWWME